MSLIGPRPERLVFVRQLEKEIPHYHDRLLVLPGITGLAQVEGWRGQTSLQKRIERDLYYIEHWSLWLDVKILFKTIWKALAREGISEPGNATMREFMGSEQEPEN